MGMNFSSVRDTVRPYTLGSHRMEIEGLSDEHVEILVKLADQYVTVTLKNMSEGDKAAYMDRIIAGQRTPLATIRREVVKWVADAGDNTIDGRPFKSAAEFIQAMPMCVVLDINAELQKPTSLNLREPVSG